MSKSKNYNKDELFKKAKSIELENGTFGYRQSTKVSVKKVTGELLHKLIERKTEEMKAEADRTVKAQLKEDGYHNITLAAIEA